MKVLFALTILVVVWLNTEPILAQGQPSAYRSVPVTYPYHSAPSVPVYTQRRNPYDVWNNYGVTSYGTFRARVIVAPCGDYYRYDSSMYPWARTRPQYWSPGGAR